jgi:hypothetical protein
MTSVSENTLARAVYGLELLQLSECGSSPRSRHDRFTPRESAWLY